VHPLPGIESTLSCLDEATTLPREAYVDARCFEIDRTLFGASWQCVAHESEIASDGFVAYEAFGDRICVTRNREGVLAGFVDRCLHRGTPLTEGSCGAIGREIVCPYHGLRYDLAGRMLEGCPFELRTAERALERVRVASWHGFVLVARASARDLEEWMGPPPPWLERAELERLRLVRRTRHEVAANWKLLIENFQESHHFPLVHPSLEAATPWQASRSIDFGGAWLGGEMDLAVDTVAVGGERRGRAFVAAPEDRQAVHEAMLFPAWLTSLQPDYFLSYRLLPKAVDRTEVVADIFFHESSGDAPSEDVTAFWDRTNAEDRAICERQQRGVSAPTYQPGAYASVEDGMHAFDRRIARAYLEHRHCAPSAEISTRVRRAPIMGIFGEPWQDLGHLAPADTLATIDSEISVGLARVESSYTGGSEHDREV
jgi:Rieske 2Fe-2S family protein